MSALLQMDHVGQRFTVRGSGWFKPVSVLQALDGIDLQIKRGQALGLVGESGCGKSTLAKVAAGFIAPSQGQIVIDGEPAALGSASEKHAARRKVQMVFQDPLSALDPRMLVGEQIEEALGLAGVADKTARSAERADLFSRVGLGLHLAERYPHQLSGGQRQRVVIARALAAKPDLLICDEPLAALDVSVQAQVLALLGELRQTLGLSYLFISHQLSTVRYLCDEVAVMYAGRIVEQGPTEAVFGAPKHPYTQMLLSTVLDPRNRGRERRVKVVGEPPNPLALPKGCPFHPRCHLAVASCQIERPALRTVGDGKVACHLAG